MYFTTTLGGVERTFEITPKQLEAANMALKDYPDSKPGLAIAAVRYTLPTLTLVEAAAIVQCARSLRSPD